MYGAVCFIKLSLRTEDSFAHIPPANPIASISNKLTLVLHVAEAMILPITPTPIPERIGRFCKVDIKPAKILTLLSPPAAGLDLIPVFAKIS